MIRPVSLLLCLASCAAAQSTMTAPVGNFPALNVQVTVGAQERAQPGSFYRKTMAILPKVTIDGPGRMTSIPAAEATMLIITMDTRAKFKDNKDVYKVYSAETLPIPEVKTGDRRQFSFAESTVTFDGYRDSSNVGGELYKYYIFGLRDPGTKRLSTSKQTTRRCSRFAKRIPKSAMTFSISPRARTSRSSSNQLPLPALARSWVPHRTAFAKKGSRATPLAERPVETG